MLRGQSYPLRPRTMSDMAALRVDIANAAAATGRSPDAKGSDTSTAACSIRMPRFLCTSASVWAIKLDLP